MKQTLILREITENVIYHHLRSDDFPYLQYWIGIKLYASTGFTDGILYDLFHQMHNEQMYGDFWNQHEHDLILTGDEFTTKTEKIDFRANGPQWEAFEQKMIEGINNYFKALKLTKNDQ